MCARIFLPVTDEELASFLDVPEVPQVGPRFNIAPGQDVRVLRADEAGRRAVALLRWGLVPRGPRDKAGPPLVIINARSETVARQPAFRDSLRRRRCLVPAAGFYEWKKVGRTSQPYAVRSTGGLVALAGLWDVSLRQGQLLESFTLLTIPANEAIAPIHDRMPVVLEREQFAAWLDPERQEAEDVAPLVRPYPADRLRVEPVSTRVNRPENDDALCLEPAAPVVPRQGTLF